MNAPLRPAGQAQELDVAIIGAGFSGLCMAIALKKAGRTNFRVFEKGADLGGTWFFNRYPGCACDVPSHLYSFSFEKNPDWSHAYSPSEEIWRYLKRTAEKYDVTPFMRFNAEVKRAEYDEAAQRWRIHMVSGETVIARAVVSGAGALHVPFYPAIKGIETFAGKTVHTAEWDAGYDLRGKRVAVIGTGASAIQLVPSIADQVKQLDVYQRTAAWVVPRADAVFSEKTKKRFRNFPLVMRLLRNFIYLRNEMYAFGFTRNRRLMNWLQGLAQRYLETAVPDPKRREKLQPNYMVGCKRLLVSNDYYPAMQRQNVELVTDTIAEVRPNGIVTADGRLRGVDAIVFATGFRVTDWLSHLEIAGKGGHVLSQEWRDGATAYYGITVAGYPNLFMLLGPNTGLGTNSIVFMIEAQVRYTMNCLDWLFEGKAGEIEVKPEVQKAFNRRLQEKMARTVWMSGCKSYYLNPNGTNSTIWPDFTIAYWWQTHSAQKRDFNLAPARIPAVAA